MSTVTKKDALAAFRTLGLSIAEMDDTFKAHGENLHPHSKQALSQVTTAAAEVSAQLLAAVGCTFEEVLEAAAEQIHTVNSVRNFHAALNGELS